MAAVTQEEFQEWLEHPVTLQMKKQIRKDISDMQDLMLDIAPEDLKELQGRCKAAINLVTMEYTDLYE